MEEGVLTKAYIVFEGEAEKRHGSFEDYFYDQIKFNMEFRS